MKKKLSSLVLCVVAVMVHSITAWAAVGRTPLAFGVGPTGDAQYSIPIFTPPGSAGMTPRLSLDYSSHSGDGLVGMGFQISGLSVITRCRSTVAQDGAFGAVTLSASDKFCLDGNRLRLASGTYGTAGSTYRTEIETFARITANGTSGSGPQSFTVEQKDGLILEYGFTADSRIEPLATGGGQVTTVATWAVSKIRDRSGNAIEFTYQEDTTYGAFRPAEIRWTSNAGQGLSAAYKVQFVYEAAPRPDILYGYNYGNNTTVNGQITEIKRLDRIDVLHNTSVVRRYELTYEAAGGAGGRSRLQSVQECGVGGSDCYSPTTFGWGNASHSTTVTTTPVALPSQPLVMDSNGDGRDDFVYSSVASGSGLWYYSHTSSNGLGSPQSTGIPNTNFALAIPTDWDGDGRWDFLVPYANNTWHVIRANGSGFDSPVSTGASYNSVNQYWVADIDGDGRGDLLRTHVAPGIAAVYARLRSGSGFASETLVTTVSFLPTSNTFMNNTFGGLSTRARSGVRQADFNGDGREDFVIHTTSADSEIHAVEYHLCVVYGAGASTGGSSCYTSQTPYQGWVTADANDDGLTDLYYFLNNQAYMLAGRGQWMGQNSPALSLAGYTLGSAIATDWDADGRHDLALVNASSGTYHLSRSSGVALSSFVNTTLNVGSATLFSAADIGGDGIPDLTWSDGTLRLNYSGWPHDRLSVVTDGFANFTQIEYEPLSGSVYTKGSTAGYPDAQDYQGPLFVVSYTFSNTGAPTEEEYGYYVFYRYYEARWNLKGRGFEGFYARKSTDSRTNHPVWEYYHRAFPLTGRPLAIDHELGNGSTFISRDTISWGAQSYGSGFETRYLPYVSQSTALRYERGGAYNGALISSATQTNTLNVATGEISVSTTTTTEPSTANGANPAQTFTERVEHLSLLNDTTNWCIGRPVTTHQTNSHTSYGGSTQTRTVDIQWDGVKCRPNSVVNQQGDPDWQVTTAYGYDGFGNINSETVTGIGMTPRTTTANWGTSGQFPMTVTNALSQTTTNGWNFALGLRTSETDPNGIVTSWQHDAFGRLTRENRPDGTASTIAYNNCPSGCSTSVQMVIATSERDTSNAVIRDGDIYVDRRERPTSRRQQTLSGAYSLVRHEYDALGRVKRESAPCWSGSCSSPFWTRYTYDTLNRLTQISRPINDSSVTECMPGAASPPCQHTLIHYEGLTTRAVDAEGKESTKTASALGATVRSLDHAGYGQTLDYDAFGNLVRVSDNGSGTTTLQSATYNIAGVRLSLTDADFGARTYTPNALGEIVSQTDALGKTISYSRDALGRVTTSVMPECSAGTITRTFTWGTSAAARNIGQLQYHELSGCAQPTFRETFIYDSFGRLTQTDSLEGTSTHFYVDRTYSATTGLLETLTYPTSTQSYRLKVQYDYQYGLPVRVKDFNAPATVFWQANATDPRGQVVDESLGSSIQTIRGHNGMTGALDYIQSGPSGSGTLQNLNYQWDRVGNLTQRQDVNQSLTEHFYYDNLHRLDYSTRNGTTNLDLTYDARGNILTKTGVGTYTYSASRIHAVTSINTGSGTVSYTYNSKGEMINRGGTQLTYFANGLVRYISKDANNSSVFSYTADGRRWANAYVSAGTQYTHRYIGDAVGTLYEKVTPGGGVTEHKYYIRGGEGSPVALYVREVQTGTPATYTNTLYYLLKDHLRSTDVVASATGAVVVRESFDAFGKRRGSNWSGSPTAAELTAMRDTTRRGFTFHEHLDSVDLIHMNGRVYDPHIARFVSPDPLVPDPMFTQAYNRYSYVNNSPLSATDPTGFAGKVAQAPKHDAINSLRENGFDWNQGGRISNIMVSCYGNCGLGQGYWNIGSPAQGALGGHWVDYSETVGAPSTASDGVAEVPVSSRQSEWREGFTGAMQDFGDALWGFGAGAGNTMMNNSPLIMVLGGGGDYNWFKGPGTDTGDSAREAAEVISAVAPIARPGKVANAARGLTAGARVNMPAWKKIAIDMGHIRNSHMPGGKNLPPGHKKDLFENMNEAQVERAIRNAYRHGEVLQSQGDSVFVRGPFGPGTIEMWVNRATKEIETAYPKF